MGEITQLVTVAITCSALGLIIGYVGMTVLLSLCDYMEKRK